MTATSMHMSPDTLQYVSELLNTTPDQIRQLIMGQASIQSVEPTDAQARAFKQTQIPDRIQGFSYTNCLMIRDVHLPWDQQVLWRADPDQHQDGTPGFSQALMDQFYEQCELERIKLGLKTVLQPKMG